MSRLPHYCPVCAYHEWNLDGLVEMCWEYLELTRVYTKPKGEDACHFWTFGVARLAVVHPCAHVPAIVPSYEGPRAWCTVRDPKGCHIRGGGCRKLATGSYDARLTSFWLRPAGKLPDFSEPVVLHKSKSTVEDFCNRIHKTMIKNFKYAMVWGSSVKHRPQRVGKEHQLHDEDIVQIVKKV